jgi:hypothetical protein
MDVDCFEPIQLQSLEICPLIFSGQICPSDLMRGKQKTAIVEGIRVISGLKREKETEK